MLPTKIAFHLPPQGFLGDRGPVREAGAEAGQDLADRGGPCEGLLEEAGHAIPVQQRPNPLGDVTAGRGRAARQPLGQGHHYLVALCIEGVQIHTGKVGHRRIPGGLTGVGRCGVCLGNGVVGPEGLTEQVARELCEPLCAAGPMGYGGGGADAYQAGRADAGVRLEPAYEARNLGGQGASVAMQLVQHEEVKGRPEEHPVLLPDQEELELLVVGQQDVGGVGADLPPRQPFRLGRRLGVRLGRRLAISGVERERDGQARPSEQPAQTIELVVRQGVHRVEEDGLDALLSHSPETDAVIENGEQEAFGLSGSGSRGDKVRPALGARPKGLLLVREKAVFAKGPSGLQQVGADHAVVRHRPQRLAQLKVVGQRDDRAAHHHVGLLQMLLELPLQVLVVEAVRGPQEPLVFLDDVPDRRADRRSHARPPTEPSHRSTAGSSSPGARTSHTRKLMTLRSSGSLMSGKPIIQH